MSSFTTPKQGSSPGLGSPSTITKYHKKTGRPIRRSAGQVKPAAGYVDSKVIDEDDDEPIELPSEDEDGQVVRHQRKRRRIQTPSPPPPPLDPLIRHEEPDEPTDDEAGSFHPRTSHAPSITLQFNVPLGFHGPLMVKLDRRLLVQDNEEGAVQDMQPCRTRRRMVSPAREPQAAEVINAKGKGFSDLPPELRNKVYRHLFVHDDIKVSFPPRESSLPHGKRSLCWSAQFLSTCRLVHSEGCSVLYGENTFLFDRNKQTRGPFWESLPREIGYTDVRRFLKVIGPENLTYLRDVYIWLEDAAPSSTPYLDHESRRYVNDEHLIDCLRILRGAKLRKLYLTFGGRRNLYRSDVKMLGYLEQIKADEVLQKGPGHWHPQKIGNILLKELQAGMTRKKKLYASD